MNTLTATVDADGIALVLIDVRDQPVNLLTAAFRADLATVIEQVAGDPAIRGAILASAKPGFIAGADLKGEEMAQALSPDPSEAPALRLARTNSFNDTLRRLETCGKPFAVAINGAALGGGFEIALACHYRALSDDPRAMVGLPEVTLGLLPGAGGTQRVPRMIGVAKALPILVEGKPLAPADALKLGLVDVLAPADQLVERCREWLKGEPDATRPWDRKGFAFPGGTAANTPAVAQLFLGATSNIVARTGENYPAPLDILSAVYEGHSLPMDAALLVEGRHAVALWGRPGAGSMMRTLFINKSWLDKAPQRPAATPAGPLRRIGVIGAGTMGGGIAYAAAIAGIEVSLLDRDMKAAERGRGYARKVLEKRLARGQTSQDKIDALLDRIRPTADFADFADCPLVVEAVFEDRTVKSTVIAAAEAAMPRDGVIASNTSTLPITSLATMSSRPAQFIGMHFFSPVDRMPLVEIIRGTETSDQTLGVALDLVQAMRKTPIVVNDARGFFTTRCFGAFNDEASALLEDGIDPLLIERAALAAGMPVAPLALRDAMGTELGLQVEAQTRADLRDAYVEKPGARVMRIMALEQGRTGKQSGRGYYDYAEDGGRTIWPGLADIWPLRETQPSLDQVRRALLYSQSLEAVKALDEGVLADAVEGDVGSVIGWGFPAYTGGVFSLIDRVGARAFVEECRELERSFGPRFAQPPGLVDRAERNAAFIDARLG